MSHLKNFLYNFFGRIKKLDLLIALYIFCLIVSELMGLKTFKLPEIFGLQLNASVAIFLFPLLFTVNDIIIETYGKARARSMALSGLLMVGLLTLVIPFFLALPGSDRFAEISPAYSEIFGKSFRISVASLIAFGIAAFLDIAIFAKIRKRLGKALWLRNNASNIISQFFDTTIFYFLAFYDFSASFEANFGFLVSLIIPYWLLKSSMSILETPFVYIGVNWLKDARGNYDKTVTP